MHRNRMKTEAEVKVVASVWGTEFIHILAARALGRIEESDELYQDDLKKRMNSSYSSKSSLYKIQ